MFPLGLISHGRKPTHKQADRKDLDYPTNEVTLLCQTYDSSYFTLRVGITEYKENSMKFKHLIFVTVYTGALELKIEDKRCFS